MKNNKCGKCSIKDAFSIKNWKYNKPCSSNKFQQTLTCDLWIINKNSVIAMWS